MQGWRAERVPSHGRGVRLHAGLWARGAAAIFVLAAAFAHGEGATAAVAALAYAAACGALALLTRRAHLATWWLWAGLDLVALCAAARWLPATFGPGRYLFALPPVELALGAGYAGLDLGLAAAACSLIALLAARGVPEGLAAWARFAALSAWVLAATVAAGLGSGLWHVRQRRAQRQILAAQLEGARRTGLRLTRLAAAVQDLAHAADVTALLRGYAAIARQLTGAGQAVAVLWGHGAAKVECDGTGPAEPPQALVERLRALGGPVRTYAGSADGGALHPWACGYDRVLAVPAGGAGACPAVICVMDAGSGHPPWDDTDQGLLAALASALGQALRLRRAAHDQAEREESVLHLLAEVVDAGERAPVGHSLRVGAYARSIALHAGLRGEALEQVAKAGLLHDIGKVGIPDAILRKPGPLDAVERAVLVSHPAIGAAIVSRVPSLAPLAPAIRHHHERWDGAGYPDRLSGDDIPFNSRVLAVAEAIDTMSTDHPYSEARPLAAVLAELGRCAGTQFDPSVVEAARTVCAEGGLQPLHGTVGAVDEQPDGKVEAAAWRVFTRLGEHVSAVLDIEGLGGRVLDLLAEELATPSGALAVLDDEGSILHVVAGREGYRDLVGSDIPRGDSPVWTAIAEGQPLRGEVRGFVPAGAEAWEAGEARALLFIPLLSGPRQPQGVLIVGRPGGVGFSDLEVRRLHTLAVPVAEALAVARLHQSLQRAARTDPLTGVGNRRLGLERLDQELAGARRTRRPLSLAILDLNDFKSINDRLGHPAGDAVLRELATRLRSHLRATDTLARHGGDEFLVILPETDTQQAGTLLGRLAAAERHATVDVPVHVGGGGSASLEPWPAPAGSETAAAELPQWSAGVAAWPEDGDEADDLLRVADQRLYRAKRHRGGRRERTRTG